MKSFRYIIRALALIGAVLVNPFILSAAETVKIPSTITLKNGATLRGVSVVKWSTDFVVLKHVGGVDRIRLDAIPNDVLVTLQQAKEQQQTISDAPLTLVGEIFVTTKGRDSVLLGSTKVAVYSSDQKETIISGLKKALDDAKMRMSVMNDVSLIELNQKMAEGRARVLASLPEPLVTTRTDSQGKFTLTVKPKEFACIVVFSDRQVFRDTENYLWVLNKSEIADPSRIILSNHNLITF